MKHNDRDRGGEGEERGEGGGERGGGRGGDQPASQLCQAFESILHDQQHWTQLDSVKEERKFTSSVNSEVNNMGSLS